MKIYSNNRFLKTIFFYLICLFLIPPSGARGQDTLYVNSEATTYLIFDDEISLFNLGNNDILAQSTNPKVLFLKAKSTTVKPTTLLLTHGNQIYQAFVVYQSPLKNPFYDFRGKKEKVESIQAKDENQLLDEKLKKLRTLDANFYLKTKKSGLVLTCQNLFNDEKGTYLKFLLENESSITYQLDHVSFAYMPKIKKKGLNHLQSTDMEDVEILKSIESNKIIPTQKSQPFFYYIPLYATSDNGFLEVIFREKNGLRNIFVNIPFKKILHAKML